MHIKHETELFVWILQNVYWYRYWKVVENKETFIYELSKVEINMSH